MCLQKEKKKKSLEREEGWSRSNTGVAGLGWAPAGDAEQRRQRSCNSLACEFSKATNSKTLAMEWHLHCAVSAVSPA